MSPEQNIKAEENVDPRVRRTRQLLKQAFTQLMTEKSFEAITIQDIADRATVNRVTFYAHFQDKYALLEHTIRTMIKERLRSQVPEGATFSQDSLARLILTVCEFLAEMKKHCPQPHGRMGPLMEKEIKAELYEILQSWLAKRSLYASHHGPTPEQAAMIASWAIYGAAIQWLQEERGETASAYVQQVLPLIEASLQPAIVRQGRAG
ncbi:MAG TPA: TetR family transcriptional regulator [Anaerolineales bacterium]